MHPFPSYSLLSNSSSSSTPCTCTLAETRRDDKEHTDEDFLKSLKWSEGQDVVVQSGDQEVYTYLGASKIAQLANHVAKEQTRRLLLLVKGCAEVCGYGVQHAPAGGFKEKASTMFKVRTADSWHSHIPNSAFPSSQSTSTLQVTNFDPDLKEDSVTTYRFEWTRGRKKTKTDGHGVFAR
jgi:hypothetical protein